MKEISLDNLKKGKKVSITLKLKGYYSPNTNGNYAEIFDRNGMEKKLLDFKDNTHWTKEFKQQCYEHAGIKSVKTFNAELIEDYGDKIRVKNLEDEKYILLDKEQIKQMKKYTSKN